jgi:glycosyltransferase involved in cell wall biosynthesis
VGGLVHVVSDERSGLLVDGWDPADHADAVLSIIEDADIRARFARGAAQWSERFSWDTTAHRFLELYQGAIQRVAGS